MLRAFLSSQRGAILARAQATAGAGLVPGVIDSDLAMNTRFLLDRLGSALLRESSAGMDLDAPGDFAGSLTGLSVDQIVHNSGDLRRAIVELADETHSSIPAFELCTLNRCLTYVVAQAVGEFAQAREASIRGEQTARLGELVHELRNVLASASMAFEMLGTGRVATGGSTSALLVRCLVRLSTLVDTSMARTRLESSVRVLERVSVYEFVGDIQVGASMEADALGLTLTVPPVDPAIDVEVDREFLTAAVSNLLQNAFKFSRAQGQICLRASPTVDRVLIEVEDECGGLPPGKADELFRPFEQRSGDRRGLGLGLAISRKSVEAIGGALRVRDIPGFGCAFTIDLPRLSCSP